MRLTYGIPEGRVIYSDLDRPAKALHSAEHALSGKPDYIVKERDKSLVPVEIKSGRAKEPYHSHILQLAAYCLLVEECYKRPVHHGIIVYSDGIQHRIKYDRALKSDLLKTVEEMRHSIGGSCPKRGHSQRQKCLRCSMNQACKESLV